MASQSDQDWQSTKKTVLERNSYMFNNPFMSDVAFTCGESEGESVKKFYAHKYVLATSSAVFYAMFYGDLAENNSVIHLPDTDEETLEAFLRFLYTDECKPDAEEALKLIYLAKKYMIPSLAEICWLVIDANTLKVLNSELFPSIDQETLEDLLKRDTLVIRGDGEVKVVEAVVRWCDHQCSAKGLETTRENKRKVLGSAVYHVRFLAMTQEEFANNVSESGLLTDGELFSFFKNYSGMTTSELTCDLPRRKGDSNSCIRFAQRDVIKPDTSRWSYASGNYDCLSFTVDKTAILYGLRLFGDANGGEYEVTMKKPVAMSGTYTSTCSSERMGKCYGFDVMLPTPQMVNTNYNGAEDIVVRIKGPNSYHGRNGKSSVEIEGLTVKFSKYSIPSCGKLWTIKSNGTDVIRGQIYELIISRYYHGNN